MNRILPLFIIMLLPLPVFAAELYFGVEKQEVKVGDNFEVGVFLNTEGDIVNAVEGNILYPSERLEFLGIQDATSIVTLWIQKPHTEKPGEIAFSGLMPGGWTGSREYVFSAMFQAKEKGQATLNTASERILLDDGKGSQAAVKRAPLTLSLSEEAAAQTFLLPHDKDMPESFTPLIAKDQNVFDGKWFLAFATQDKGSGIDRYEVLETREKTLKQEERWIQVESPYLLKDQSLESFVYVKAIDRAGNERIEMVGSSRRPWRYNNYLVWSIIGGLGILVLAYGFWRARRKPTYL